VLDRVRILAKLDEAEGHARDLEGLVPRSVEAYKASLAERLASERLFQLATECLLDAAELLVAGRRLGLPSDERRVVTRLAEAGLLAEDHAATLRAMQGFRNLLVHRYGHLDPAKTHAHLLWGAGEVRRMAQALRAALDASPGK
jgi:uncharacterized protein YutE (UPF0331/DUF86 family)